MLKNSPTKVSDITHHKRRSGSRITGNRFGVWRQIMPTDYLLAIFDDTVRQARPLARRRASTLRPSAVAILSRKPCLLTLLRLEGWNVLFIAYFVFRYFASVFSECKFKHLFLLTQIFMCALYVIFYSRTQKSISHHIEHLLLDLLQKVFHAHHDSLHFGMVAF